MKELHFKVFAILLLVKRLVFHIRSESGNEKVSVVKGSQRGLEKQYFSVAYIW